MKRLSNKVALVTGAARGIGRSIALRFAQEGCAVAISDINLEGAQSVGAELTALGVQSTALLCNVTQRSEVEHMIAEVVGQLGRLDILVNNAGIFFNAAFEAMTDDEWNRTININLNSVFLVSQVAVRHWLRVRQPGNIINLASISADVAFTESAHYCASKAGVASLTRCVATELGPQGIRCNSLAPGIIATEMTKHSLSEAELYNDWMQRTPLRRYGTPDDVANAALFLASDESSYVNGEMLRVDAGALMTWSKPSDMRRYPREW